MTDIKRKAASWATKAKTNPAGPALGHGEASPEQAGATAAVPERKKPGPAPAAVKRNQYGFKASNTEIARIEDLTAQIRALDGVVGKVDRSSALVAAALAVEHLLRSDATSAALRSEVATLLGSWHRHEEKPDY